MTRDSSSINSSILFILSSASSLIAAVPIISGDFSGLQFSGQTNPSADIGGVPPSSIETGPDHFTAVSIGTDTSVAYLGREADQKLETQNYLATLLKSPARNVIVDLTCSDGKCSLLFDEAKFPDLLVALETLGISESTPADNIQPREPAAQPPGNVTLQILFKSIQDLDGRVGGQAVLLNDLQEGQRVLHQNTSTIITLVSGLAGIFLGIGLLELKRAFNPEIYDALQAVRRVAVDLSRRTGVLGTGRQGPTRDEENGGTELGQR